jgi:hypothetical protein
MADADADQPRLLELDLIFEVVPNLLANRSHRLPQVHLLHGAVGRRRLGADGISRRTAT